MRKSARCGRENDFSNSPLVVFSHLIGKKTQAINRRDMLKFMSWKGDGSMAYVPGEPKHDVKCARCGIQGVLFTQIKNKTTGKGDWYCTANCALKATDSKGVGLGGQHVKQQSPIPKEDIKMTKKERRAAAAAAEEAEKAGKTSEKDGKAPEKEEKKKGKGKLGEHLTPKEPVIFPKELLKHPEIGEALKVLTTCDRSSREGSKARLALRNKGFKLSDEATWKPFLKKVSK